MPRNARAAACAPRPALRRHIDGAGGLSAPAAQGRARPQDDARADALEGAPGGRGRGLPGRLAAAIEKSGRIMAEDLIREAGYMLPQSGNAREF
jgi:hypothetical protein